MRSPFLLITIVVTVTLICLSLLLQTPGSLSAALSHPFHVLWGTDQELNARLIEVSEDAETFRAAGRRLLQPLGGVRLVRTYSASDSDSAKKKN